MEYRFSFDGEEYELELEQKNGEYVVELDDSSLELDVKRISDNVISVISKGKNFRFYLAKKEEKHYVFHKGSIYILEDLYEKGEGQIVSSETGSKAGGKLTADMPGKILKIPVSEGDTVEEGQTLLIQESMKMENSLKSETAGSVEKIYVQEGDQVELGDTLIDITGSENQ